MREILQFISPFQAHRSPNFAHSGSIRGSGFTWFCKVLSAEVAALGVSPIEQTTLFETRKLSSGRVSLVCWWIIYLPSLSSYTISNLANG
jgi:hypothetical protein